LRLRCGGRLTLKRRVDLLIGNPDARAVPAAHHDLPGDFGADLLTQGLHINAVQRQIGGDFINGCAVSRRSVLKGGVHLASSTSRSNSAAV
jgi:hypothetical protein